MKKIKMTIAVVALSAAVFAGYTAYEQATMTDQERLILANIEALTSGEEATKECDGDGNGCTFILNGATYYAPTLHDVN